MNPLEARRRLLGRNVYKRTTEGNPAIAQGSLARRYPGITMQGWTEQAQYEGKNLFNIDGDVNTQWNGTTGQSNTVQDGILTSGYNPGEGYIKGQVIDVTPDSTISISFDVLDVGTGTNAYVEVYAYGTNSVLKGYYDGVGNNIKLSGISVSEGQILVGFGTARGTGAQYTNIQVEYGDTPTSYEPYTGGQPSPNPDYPQPITSAGKYDEETQKWEYEITIANAQTDPDKNQTVTLTSDRPLTKWDKLGKRNGQWGWVYKSAEIESYTDESVPGEYFSTTGQLSTGAQVWYETTTETFIPLTASEQEAMNELYTFRPTTVLSNDCECEMTLTYKTRKSMEVSD